MFFSASPNLWNLRASPASKCENSVAKQAGGEKKTRVTSIDATKNL